MAKNAYRVFYVAGFTRSNLLCALNTFLDTKMPLIENAEGSISP